MHTVHIQEQDVDTNLRLVRTQKYAIRIVDKTTRTTPACLTESLDALDGLGCICILNAWQEVMYFNEFVIYHWTG